MLVSCWHTLNELAPWLLLGMFVSGALHVLLPEGFVRRRFRGFSGILKSVGIGVPLPLCSCGVIPAGIGLKNQGASNGAAVGFLISTPQTGVDSILVSASFFGWPFAIFKTIAAAVTGVIGGWMAEPKEVDDPLAIVGVTSAPVSTGAESCCGDEKHDRPLSGSWRESVAWRLITHSVDTFRSIWGWLVIGVLVSVLIEQFLPPEWLASVGSWGLFPAMLLMLLISTPLYVCATASVPIAAALVRGGLPAGAAIVFLMAGPATNVTTIGAIQQHFGKKALIAYLSSIVVGSMVGAGLFHTFFPSQVSIVSGGHHHHHTTWWTELCALFLVGLMVMFAASDVRRRWQTGEWGGHGHHH